MKLYQLKYKAFLFILSVLIVCGCATYYKKTLQFQEYIYQGQYQRADDWLENKSKDKKGKNELLYNLNRGYVNFMLQQHPLSNQYFQTADRIIEDNYKSLGAEALSLITNPNIKPYRAEDFEAVMLYYFTALNYIMQGKYDEAIVECKRVNIKLNQINDKYKDSKNRYQQDAFAHTLMGLVYEANNDYNNAFIAYRNAYDVYEKDYKKQFGIGAPEQLKHDLLRTAYITGFFDEVRYYEKLFNTTYHPNNSSKNELVFFWMNGFGPIKHEWSINFTAIPGNDGFVTFVHPELALNFRFYIGNKPQNEKNGFAQLRFLRIAFPKYIERKPYYTSAFISFGNETKSLELLENINEIAFKTLHDRMLRELGNSLLRMASKKALEMAVSSQNQNLGTAVSIANAISEKADTRNWQTLPYALYYVRIPLQQGSNKINLNVKSPNGNQKSYQFTFETSNKKMEFFSFHNIETTPSIY